MRQTTAELRFSKGEGMKRHAVIAFTAVVLAVPLWPKSKNPKSSEPMLKITSRAVLVDVIVTGKDGKPVTGLSKDAFTVTDQGKPQAITFFEENGTRPIQPAQMPKLPPDVFSNFSPFPQPPAVNVILLDSLNTKMEDQSFVHTQALKFLNSAKPGTRAAIFTMGLELHFIQGFNDDPAVLAAALSNKKNTNVETQVLLKGQAEANAQAELAAAGAGMQHFFQEMEEEQVSDRELLTLTHLQELAAFLQSFPGRKNIIWFTEKVPGGFVAENGLLISNPVVDYQLRKTFAMLGAARAAIYPVDARGTSVNANYTAENNPAAASTGGEAIRSEDQERNSDQMNAQVVAEESGGHAFANMNGLSDILGKVTAESGHFYTLSYVPTNAKMDGAWRKISVKVAGGSYHLSYRRGYFAVDTDSPAGSPNAGAKKAKNGADEHPAAADPLLAFMQLGMPQSEQIVYQARVTPQPPGPAASSKEAQRYAVDLAVDLKDLDLQPDSDGTHRGVLNLTLLTFDRYGNVINHQEHVAALSIKPADYAMFQKSGVHLHADVSAPKGNYWLRTGIYDAGSHKVGTLEIPLAAIRDVAVASISGSVKPPRETAKPKLPRAKTERVATRAVTVAQLEQLVAQLAATPDKDAARQIAVCKLTERLNSDTLEKLLAALPGQQARSALIAVADVSGFLPPPQSDLLQEAAPALDAQRATLSKAIDYVIAKTKQMPDFLADEQVTRFGDTRFGIYANDPVITTPDVFHQIDSRAVTVQFRNGREEQAGPPAAAKTAGAGGPQMGLTTWGVFGPMLQTVMRDILQGKIGWARWEASSSGKVAVFRYAVPRKQATYTVRWCCIDAGPGIYREIEMTPQYHGEISIDPASGAVMRVVLVAEPEPGQPVLTADAFVEYGPVEIGGRIYICPKRSATLLTANSPMERGQYVMGGQAMYHESEENIRVTSISDSVFDRYHVFRSEMKIVER
jgi:VWFA-related protein